LRIFDLDGPLYKIGTEIADVMIVTIYWILGCLPIFTIGASTAAAYYVYGKKIRGEDVYLTKDFFKSFKQNFKQSFAVTFILGILWFSASLYLILLFYYGVQTAFYLTVLALFFLLEVMAITIYSLGLYSRFYMKTTALFMTAFALVHRHLLSSITMIILNIALAIVSSSNPVLILLFPVCNIVINSFFLQRLFKKHIENDLIETESKKEELKENMELEDALLENDIEDILEKEQTNAQSENKQEESLKSKESDQEDSEDKDFLKYI